MIHYIGLSVQIQVSNIPWLAFHASWGSFIIVNIFQTYKPYAGGAGSDASVQLRNGCSLHGTDDTYLLQLSTVLVSILRRD